MYCSFCHSKYEFSKCKCYLLDMGDAFTCAQCHRIQNNMIYTAPIKYFYDDNNIKLMKKYNIIYEICEKLNLSDKIKNNITIYYNNIINNLGRSTYNRLYILIFSIYNILLKNNIFIHVNKLCKIISCPFIKFHKTCLFLKTKNINLVKMNYEKICSNILFQLKVNNEKYQDKIINKVINIASKTNIKIPTLVAAAYCKYCIDITNIKFIDECLIYASSIEYLHKMTILKCYKKYFAGNKFF